jgi:cytochrome P450
MLSLASADRDPARFPAPDLFDAARAENPHLAFGHGIHYCLGAPLARVEGQIAIGTLLRRFPDLALAVAEDELSWRPSFRSRGLGALPVTF